MFPFSDLAPPMSTASICIYETLRKHGFLAPKVRYSTAYQLFMYFQCNQFESTFYDQFSEQDFDRSNPRFSMWKIFDELFATGVTLGRIIAMYFYASLFALEFARRDSWIMYMSLPAWTDEYIDGFLKPRLIENDQWQFYEKFFHLLKCYSI